MTELIMSTAETAAYRAALKNLQINEWTKCLNPFYRNP